MYHNKTFFGRKVRVILKTGETFVDRFERSGNSYIMLREHGRIPRAHIKAWTLYNPAVEAMHGYKQAA